MTKSVIAPKQVQRCVQVRVDLVYSVSNGFQSRPPVRSLRLLFAGGHMSEQAQPQQEDTDVAAHSPRNVGTPDERLAARR